MLERSIGYRVGRGRQPVLRARKRRRCASKSRRRSCSPLKGSRAQNVLRGLVLGKKAVKLGGGIIIAFSNSTKLIQSVEVKSSLH